MSQTAMNKQLTIGLFGFGVVGEALYTVLQSMDTLNARVSKVCIKHADKERNAPAELFTTDANELLDDEEINVIVELIDDSEASFEIVSKAMRNGKAVVSANKKMIAEHFEQLLLLQAQHLVPILYESACCASIPVIRNLEEYYDNDLLQSISGIVNGSTNYILSKIADEQVSFSEALTGAQAAGFAESDPYMDVAGVDAVNKLSILLAHAYGIVTPPDELIFSGIRNLDEADFKYSREKGMKVKLVAQAKKLRNGAVAAFVLPQFVREDSQLFGVTNEYNGVIIESNLADKQFFSGKGAGGFPTASAVLSDLSALRYNYKYEYKKLRQRKNVKLTHDFYLRVFVSFASLSLVPQQLFEHIEEWSINDKRCCITGVIHGERLLDGWWKEEGTSLILLPEGVTETKPERVRSVVEIVNCEL